MKVKFDTKKKVASMGLVIGAVLYIAFFMNRLYSDWATLVTAFFTPSVSGLALLITLAKYVMVGGDVGTYFKSWVLTIAIIFGIGVAMGWIGVV